MDVTDITDEESASNEKFSTQRHDNTSGYFGCDPEVCP
jgi:hypothetical protein